jgi:hypothetical protein
VKRLLKYLSSSPLILLMLISFSTLMPYGAGAEEDTKNPPKSLNTLFQVQQTDLRDSDIRRDVRPSRELRAALAALKRRDRDAQVTWFRDNVDSFSTRPKTTIPDYAQVVLRQVGVRLTPVSPQQLPLSLQQKPQINWDDRLNEALPFDAERDVTPQSPGDEEDKPEGQFQGQVIQDQRPNSKPAPQPEPIPVKREATIARRVLVGFLNQNSRLFNIPKSDLEKGLPNLEQVEYTSGKYFKRLTFQQKVNDGILHNGKTVVLFDHNWNVINISRIIITPNKLDSIVKRNQPLELDKGRATRQAVELTNRVFNADVEKIRVPESTLGLDAIRGIYTWKVRVLNADPVFSDLTLTFDAHTGKLLNVSDNVDRYTDAQVNRWGYADGDYTTPNRYTTGNFYTRDDNTLVHDFFHVVNDNRNNGNALDTCTATPANTLTEGNAYGTTSGSNYIRPTRRSDRNFLLWWPSEQSGTFGESHVYYWARWFMQWMKPALADLGVLPNSAADYPQALIITNACEDGVGVHSSSFSVTTYQNIGEGINTIRLPERCRSTNDNCSSSDYDASSSDHIYTYEGNAGYSSPSVIHHELNHFVMKRYFGIGSGQDCSAGEQLKFLHEGAAGRSLPQAYWHNYYGTGYAPTNQNRQYRADAISGRPHINNSSLNRLSDFLCVNTDSPYDAGSVVHQAMWKFYHGIAVNGSTQTGIARVSTDRDFLVLYYWAADLVSASTYQDRYEMANRVMQIMENHSPLSSSGKQSWCAVWRVHELADFIDSSYCN